MTPSASGLSRQAIGWALLSQAIWLPLLGIAVHDRWLSRQSWQAPATPSRVAERQGNLPPPSLGDLLKATAPPPRPAAMAMLPATSAPPRSSPARRAGTATTGLTPSAPSAGLAPGMARAGWVLRSPSPANVRPTVAASGGHSRPVAPSAGGGLPARPWVATAEVGLSHAAARPSQLLGGSLQLQDLPLSRVQPLAPPSQATDAGLDAASPLAPPSGVVRIRLGSERP